MDKMQIKELSACSNMKCGLRLACERAHIESSNMVEFNNGEPLGDDDQCHHFIVRSKLGGGNPDAALGRRSDSGGRRRRKHNLHAPQTPGSLDAIAVDFFGERLKEDHRPHRRDNYGTLGKADFEDYTQKPDLPKAPDLMVKRHLRRGRDIKKGDEDGSS